MKRYLLFTATSYEAYGGFGDLDGSFDTLEEAKDLAIEYAEASGWDFHTVHIVDTKIGHLFDLSIHNEWDVKNV